MNTLAGGRLCCRRVPRRPLAALLVKQSQDTCLTRKRLGPCGTSFSGRGYATVGTHSPVPIPDTAHRAHLPARGEPETHSHMVWSGTFRELVKTDIPFVPWLARPFLTQFPEEYLRAGQGHHGQGDLTRVQILEEAFSEKRDAD